MERADTRIDPYERRRANRRTPVSRAIGFENHPRRLRPIGRGSAGPDEVLDLPSFSERPCGGVLLVRDSRMQFDVPPQLLLRLGDERPRGRGPCPGSPCSCTNTSFPSSSCSPPNTLGDGGARFVCKTFLSGLGGHSSVGSRTGRSSEPHRFACYVLTSDTLKLVARYRTRLCPSSKTCGCSCTSTGPSTIGSWTDSRRAGWRTRNFRAGAEAALDLLAAFWDGIGDSGGGAVRPESRPRAASAQTPTGKRA